MRNPVMDYGLHSRQEVVEDLKSGTRIRFSDSLKCKRLGLDQFDKVMGLKKKKIKSKKKVARSDIFLSLEGYRNGNPLIRVLKPMGKICVVEAIGYEFALGENKGESICSYKVCSRKQQYETTRS